MLNVFTTRTREKYVVFSNLRSMDMRLNDDSPFELRALKGFLEYAKTRNFETRRIPAGDYRESAFEDVVDRFLTEKGYQVRNQVGCAGFRVGLAIANPVSAGEYLWGIECDVVKYHNFGVARDRDRLRQQMLDKLGWRIVRVWSTD